MRVEQSVIPTFLFEFSMESWGELSECDQVCYFKIIAFPNKRCNYCNICTASNAIIILIDFWNIFRYNIRLNSLWSHLFSEQFKLIDWFAIVVHGKLEHLVCLSTKRTFILDTLHQNAIISKCSSQCFAFYLTSKWSIAFDIVNCAINIIEWIREWFKIQQMQISILS